MRNIKSRLENLHKIVRVTTLSNNPNDALIILNFDGEIKEIIGFNLDKEAIRKQIEMLPKKERQNDLL